VRAGEAAGEEGGMIAMVVLKGIIRDSRNS
jgi:hypothetical protein